MFSFTLTSNVQKMLGGAVVFTLLFAPISSVFTIQKAEAQLFGGGGRIVVDRQNIFTNTLQTIAAESLAQKDLVLDGIFYNIAQRALQQLTGNILSFINTGGQNVQGERDGRPTFVTNYLDLMDEVTFETSSELIYGEALNAVCTPFQLNVRIAIAAHLQAQLETSGENVQRITECSPEVAEINMEAFFDGALSAGGWSVFLKTALNPQNTTMGAYLAGVNAIDNAAARERWATLEDARNGQGYQSVRTCTTVEAATGPRQDCRIATPGILLREQATAALGAPMQSILNADEFDEVVGALFGNLANEAISGINGLLGLSDRTHGAGGNQSYFDAIRNDPTNGTTNGQTSDNPIGRALATETRVGTAEIGIINAIQNLTRCSPDVVLPPELRGVLTEFTPKVIATGEIVAQLSDMAVAYASSTSGVDKGRILSQLESLRTDGRLSGLPVAIQYEQFLNSDLRDFIAAFKRDTNYVEVSCTTPQTP